MDDFYAPQGKRICYNKHVSRKRDNPIFDIGPCQLVGRAPRARRRAATGHRLEALVGSRVPRDRIGATGNAYATAYWSFRENHYFSRMKQNTVLRRVDTTRRNLFLLLHPGS